VNHSYDISVIGNDMHCEVMKLLGSLLGHVFQSMTDLKSFSRPLLTRTSCTLLYQRNELIGYQTQNGSI
jgi:hypothetical protein